MQFLLEPPILFRQSVGSDVSQWYWEERSVLPYGRMPDPFYADVAKQHTRRREKPVGESP